MELTGALPAQGVNSVFAQLEALGEELAADLQPERGLKHPEETGISSGCIRYGTPAFHLRHINNGLP